MALAIVKLSKRRGNRTFEFLDYLSLDVARLGVEIQGSEHAENEFSVAKIVKVVSKD